MKLIFFGAPGTGKGTQGKILSQAKGWVHISTGDILRKAVADGTELGKKAKAIMDQGGLVSDDIIIGLMEERLAQDDCKKGYILDGFPRTIKQAEDLDAMLAGKAGIDAVVYFAVDEDEIVKRITSRRTCTQCGYNHNMIYDPPVNGDKCAKCGGTVIQRDDDKEGGPDQVEKEMDDGRTVRCFVGADGREHGGDAGADILTKQDEQRRMQADQA